MRSFFFCLLIMILSGCSFWSSKTEPQLSMTIQAAENINPNTQSKPSPLELRVYQLSDNQTFKQADFLQIFNDPQGTLKTDLLAARQLESIFPGEKREIILPIVAEAKYIGIVAGFADYQEAKNKVIYMLRTDETVPVNINIDGVNLSLVENK